MDALDAHLNNLGSSDKTPPTEGDLRVAAEVLRQRAQRESDPIRTSLERVADFAMEVAPMVGLLATMAEQGQLPDLGGLFRLGT